MRSICIKILPLILQSYVFLHSRSKPLCVICICRRRPWRETNANGRQVYARVWPALGQYDRMPVALGGLAQGVYFWEIQAENGMARGKVLKE